MQLPRHLHGIHPPPSTCLPPAEWQDPRHAPPWDAPPLPPRRRGGRRSQLGFDPAAQQPTAEEEEEVAEEEWSDEDSLSYDFLSDSDEGAQSNTDGQAQQAQAQQQQQARQQQQQQQPQQPATLPLGQRAEVLAVEKQPEKTATQREAAQRMQPEARQAQQAQQAEAEAEAEAEVVVPGIWPPPWWRRFLLVTRMAPLDVHSPGWRGEREAELRRALRWDTSEGHSRGC